MRAPSRVACVAAAVLLGGCAPPRPADPNARYPAPSPDHGLETAATGVGYLLMSPLMIAAGLLEGIISLPYFIAMDVHQLNEGMIESGARVDLDRTYEYAYGEAIPHAGADGDTGHLFRHLHEATRHFQRVLMGYGVEDYNRYVLTAVRTADRDGYTLYAVVHRPPGAIEVRDEATGRPVRVAPGDAAYYRPYARDVRGRPLDVVIDWAGVPRTSIGTQKGQAILMTIAANSVLVNRRSDDYWPAETRWISGAYRQVVAEREGYLKKRMGLTG